jgi:hypothetical protein
MNALTESPAALVYIHMHDASSGLVHHEQAKEGAKPNQRDLARDHHFPDESVSAGTSTLL